jgi:hypothetical protein
MSEDFVNRYNTTTKLWERVPRTAEHEPGAIAKGTLLVPVRASDSDVGTDIGLSTPSYRGGSVRSVQMLNMLRFDPIEQLVAQYRKLEEELLWHEQLREGNLIPLRPSGKPYTYNAEHHIRVFERLESIGSQLLRYGYGRVSETIDLNVNRPNKLVFNLSKKGETFVINDNKENDNGD